MLSTRPVIDEEFLERIPRDFARRHLILGLERRDEQLSLLVSETTSPAVIHNVGTCLGVQVQSTVCEAEAIARLIDEA